MIMQPISKLAQAQSIHAAGQREKAFVYFSSSFGLLMILKQMI